MPSANNPHKIRNGPSPDSDVGTRTASQYRLDPLHAETLTAFYDGHHENLCRYASKIVHDRDLAEDLVQQAFTATLEALESGTRIENYSAYLNRCIRNLALNQLRHDPVAALCEADHMGTSTTSLEIMDLKERWRTVEKAIDTLPEHFRAVLVLAELRGLSYQEIATVLDRSLGSVRQILRRARIHVRQMADPDKVPIAGPLVGLHSATTDVSFLQSVRERVANRLDPLRNWLATVTGQGGESLAAPVTALIAATLVVSALSGPPVSRHQAAPTQHPAGPLAFTPSANSRLDMEAGQRPFPAKPRNEPRRVNTRSSNPTAKPRRPANEAEPGRDPQKPVGEAATAGDSVPADTSADPLDEEAGNQNSAQPGSGWASMGYDGAPPNDSSEEPSVSAGATNVAFASAASNLVPGDTNGAKDVFVQNAGAQSTFPISVGVGGRPANGLSDQPTISAQAPVVAFTSSASNLVLGDTNGVRDIFVREFATNQTTRASVSSSGKQANGKSDDPTVSADGRFVAFASTASNLLEDERPADSERSRPSSGGHDSLSRDAPGDSNGFPDVLIHDLKTGVTERVSVSSNAEEADGPSVGPVISADGRHVAFTSSATNLVAEDDNGLPDVFVRDRVRKTTQRVSVGLNGQSANGKSTEPAIAADGRWVAFSSTATNIASTETGEHFNVYVRDLQRGESRLVSARLDDGPGAGARKTGFLGNAPTDFTERFTYTDSRRPSISADGRYIAFESVEQDLDPTMAGKPGLNQVFVRDMHTEMTRLASENASGQRWPSLSPAIDPLGEALVYVIRADLTGGGLDFTGDAIYLRRLSD